MVQFLAGEVIPRYPGGSSVSEKDQYKELRQCFKAGLKLGDFGEVPLNRKESEIFKSNGFIITMTI